MDMIVLQFGVVILAAIAGYWLFGRMHLSRALGAVLAGLLLGPSLLGTMPVLGFEHGLFPVTHGVGAVPPELFAFSAVAAVLFFFVLGMETDIKMLQNHCVKGGVPAMAGMAVSFVLGDIMGIQLLRLGGNPNVGFMSPECLLLGVIGTATASGIAIRIFARRRRLDSPEATTFLACATSDGLFVIVLMAIILGSVGAFLPAHGQRQYSAAHLEGSPDVLVIWLALLLCAVVLAGPLARLWKGVTDRSGMAVAFLGISLVVAGVFDRAGLITVLGAYVVGVALSRSDISRVLREKAVSIYGILVPMLFCTIGMMIDIKSLASTKVLVAGVLFAVMIVVARFACTSLLTMPMGFSASGAARIGAAMIPRGELSLLIVGIGIVEGILPPELAGVSLIMIAATAATGASLSHLAINSGSPGTRNAAARPGARKMEFTFPSTETAESAVARLMAVFMAEGFSIHSLDIDAGIYLVRKDDMAIGIQRTGCDLMLDCSENESSLANAAICEAIAELERVVSDLRRTVDEKAIVRQLQDSNTIGSWKLSLADYLTPSTIRVSIAARTKQEAISELIELLAAQSLVRNVDEAKKAIWSREEIMSTGMQHGIAIPHGKTHGVDKLVCALGLKRDGVDFASLDGELSKIIILVLSPDNVVAPYMQLVATIGHDLDEKLRTLLLACRTSAEVMTVLGGGGITVQEAKAQPGEAGPSSAVQVQPSGSPALSEFMRPEQVSLDLAASTKAEVIDELLHLLEENGHIKNFKEARKAVMDRESKMATGTQDGVAIPHAITQAVSSLVCAIGIKRDGIEFGSVDGKPSTLFIMALAPKEELPRYIQFLGTVGRIVSEPGRESILRAKTRQQLCDVFTGTSSEP
ncbi:MAG: PTS sugar transporter subunit IIA [bacterium]